MIATTGLEPPRGVEALLFDCDGTLVDTTGLYRICWHQVYGRYGFEMSEEWFEARKGLSVHPFVREALPDLDEDAVLRVADEGVSLFLESTHLLRPLESVVDIARRYHGRLPMAVVSGGRQDAVIASLDVVGITDLFDVIVTLSDIANGKPDPEAYLVALDRLGASPAGSAAYEDSDDGVASALAAGIGTVFDVRRGHAVGRA